MKKSLKTFQLLAAVILTLVTLQSNAQMLEWRLANPVYSAVDPDAGGSATGSVTFQMQIHKTTAGSINNINVISTGWSYQSLKAMVPTTPGCATVTGPANVTVSPAFVAAGFSYTTVQQCANFPQTTGGQVFDRRSVGTLDGTSINITNAWIDVFTVTLWSLGNSEAGFTVLNHGSGHATVATGQNPNYSVSDDQGNEYSVASTTYATPLGLNSSAMPISLAQFDVTCNNNGIRLNWQTLAEQNSSHFEVERSDNGAASWTSIGTVQAAGMSNSVKNYEFIDVKGGNAIYRLRQVDKDSKFTYSSVLKINCKSKQTDLFVYPVPAKNIMNIVINTERNSKAGIMLIDVAGRIVRQLQTDLQSGSNNIKLNVAGLAPGEYFLKVAGTEISKTHKVTVIN